jgi:phosphosulfolactate phosphohydrolase-like enzyme
MRREWTGMVGPQIELARQSLVNASQTVKAVANAEPQHARRSAFREKPEAVEGYVEAGLINHVRQRSAHAFFHRGVDVAEKVQRQVHAIRMYPRGLGLFLDYRAYRRQNSLDLRARALVDVNRNK